jgi:hypothetical protein
VVTDAVAERRRRQTIDQLRNHPDINALQVGDVMFCVGTAEELGSLEELFTQRLGR